MHDLLEGVSRGRVNSIFIRVFGGILLALALAILLCLLLFHALNHVRFMQYQERLAAPLFGWLEKHQGADARAQIMTVLPLGAQIRLVDAAELKLSQVKRDRLRYGQILVDSGRTGTQVMARTSDGRIRLAFFPHLYQDLSLLSARLLAMQVQALSPESQKQALPELAGRLQVDARLLSANDLGGLSVVARQQLEQQGWMSYQDHARSRQVTFVRLGDNHYLAVKAPNEFNPFAWPVVVAMAGLLAFVLGLAIYVLLNTLEQRLRRLEIVASRIARGELEARIDVSRLDALGRLGSVFNSMAEQIQRLVHVQREMIHAVSHELRTPVARIRFGVQMIEDCPDQAAVAKQLAGIDSDIQELNELIDEILTYARLEQGGPILDFQETNIRDIVQQVVQEQSTLKPEISIQATFTPESERWKLSEVEPRYIHRALQNLVGNGLRYANRQVLVRCCFDKETCRIDVEDDGPGIPEQDWERVFTPFARLDDSRTRSSGGYGLGLSIVRRILYWHGGQAFLGRSDLGGARFTLIWPRKQLK